MIRQNNLVNTPISHKLPSLISLQLPNLRCFTFTSMIVIGFFIKSVVVNQCFDYLSTTDPSAFNINTKNYNGSTLISRAE